MPESFQKAPTRASATVLAAILAVFPVCNAYAQGVTSDIRGTITDTSGASIEDATVTLVNETKGWSRSAKSGPEGDYVFLQVPPADTLSIFAELAGFKKEIRSGIVL